jgi:hypothetical protein
MEERAMLLRTRRLQRGHAAIDGLAPAVGGWVAEASSVEAG